MNKDFGRIRQALRAQKSIVALLPKESSELRQAHEQLAQLEDENDDLHFLSEAVKTKSSNLRMTSSDIRLLYGIIDQQLKLGEIQSGRTNGRSTPTQELEISNSIDAGIPISGSENEIDSSVQSPVQNSEEVLEPEPITVVGSELSRTIADIDAFLLEGESE